MDQVQIANLALMKLGQTPINSFEDRSRAAELIKLYYPIVRDVMLEEQEWSFIATRYTSTSTEQIGNLAPCCSTDCKDTSACNGWPEWGTGLWVHSIDPCIDRIIRCYGQQRTPIQTDWVKEGNYVLSSRQTIYILGMRNLEDPNKWSDSFSMALAYRLASDICIAVTENQNLQVQLFQLADEQQRRAAVNDAIQSRGEKIQSSSLVRVRDYNDFGGVIYQ